MGSMACRNSPGLVPDVDTPSPTRAITSSRPNWPSGYTVPPMITDIGTTTIPSCWTNSRGIEAALSVRTVTVMYPRGYDAPWSGSRVITGVLPGLAGQGHGRRHMGEVADALGEVSQQRTVLDIHFLGEQAEIVGCRRRVLEDLSGLVDPILARQTLDEPERAREEGALAALEAVFALVPAQ